MRRALAVGVICLASSLAFAASEVPLNVKSGLWKIETTVSFSGLPPQMQAMLHQMTPEQKRAMGFGGTTVRTSCVTPKERSKPWLEGATDCNWTILKSTSTDLVAKGTACQEGKDEGMNSTVEIKVHARDPEHVEATMHGTGTLEGSVSTVDGKYTGTWMGASCRARNR